MVKYIGAKGKCKWHAVTIVKLFGRIEDITWPRGDTKFLFERVKYFSTSEEKFRISKRPCNFLFIYKILTTGQNALFLLVQKLMLELEDYSLFLFVSQAATSP